MMEWMLLGWPSASAKYLIFFVLIENSEMASATGQKYYRTVCITISHL
jgi:hypothetical protein